MSRRPPQNGLFCWWLPWAGPTGSQQIPDRSNNKNHGTMNGFTPSSDWVVDGGWALNFDGTNNYVLSTNANQFQETVGDRQFSFSGWFKTATAGFGTIFSAGVTATSDPSMFLRADATNNTLLQFFIRNGAGTVNFNITSTSAVNTDKWIHVAAVNGGNGSVGARLYINGIEEASQASYSGNTAQTWERFGIGATIRNTISTYFNGCMDDVRLYSRALTASDVRSLYLCGRGAGFRESTIAKYNIASTQNISLNDIAATTSVYNPSLTASAAISLNAIAATTTVYNPTVTATAAILLNAIAATTQVYEPTVVAAGTTQNVSLNLIPATTVVYNPTINLQSNDTSDILTRGLKRLRQDEENVAAQLLQKRQQKGTKKRQKAKDWKKEILARIQGAETLEVLEVIDITPQNVTITDRSLASIEKTKEAKRQELLAKQAEVQEAFLLAVKTKEEAQKFEQKQANRRKRLKALMWLANLDL